MTTSPPDTWQWWAVGFTVGLAGLSLAWRLVFGILGRKKGKCGGCGNCGKTTESAPPLTQLVIRPRKSAEG